MSLTMSIMNTVMFSSDPDHGDHDSDNLAQPQEGYPGRPQADALTVRVASAPRARTLTPRLTGITILS